MRDGKIDGTSDFSARGLGELKAWLEPWFLPRIRRNGGGGTTLTIQDEGVDLPTELKLNFIGSAVTATDDPGNNRTDVTITGGTVLKKLVVTWGGAIPTSLGNGLVWRVPYDTDGSTLSFTLARAYFRIETPNLAGAATSIRLEKAPGGDVVFVPTTIVSLSLTSASDYEVENTGLSTVVSSGDLLRIVFTAVGADGSAFDCELIGTE